MEKEEGRIAARSDMLLSADVCVGLEPPRACKVKNISSAGLMGEMMPAPPNGAVVALRLDDLGWIEGKVAWSLAPRFGVEFSVPIDPATVPWHD